MKPKPLYKIGDKVFYITIHGLSEAIITEVYESRKTFAYTIRPATDGTPSSKLGIGIKEEDLYERPGAPDLRPK